jgi:hypothetical protein
MGGPLLTISQKVGLFFKGPISLLQYLAQSIVSRWERIDDILACDTSSPESLLHQCLQRVAAIRHFTASTVMHLREITLQGVSVHLGVAHLPYETLRIPKLLEALYGLQSFKILKSDL